MIYVAVLRAYLSEWIGMQCFSAQLLELNGGVY